MRPEYDFSHAKPLDPMRAMAERTTILRVPAGSTLHGLHLPGKDDRDEIGVCVEDMGAAMGFGLNTFGTRFEQYVYRTATEREGRYDAPSQPGDLDLVIYGLRKFLRLAMDGNPQILQCLFVPLPQAVSSNAWGEALQDMAPLIVSRLAGRRYIGYLQSQRERLEGVRGQKRVNRPELDDAHGFDTKYAMHVLRLGYQGAELMTTGRLTLPMRAADRNFVYATRLGEVPLPDVLARASELEGQIRDRLDDSPLRAEPARDEVEAWMLRVYFESWRLSKDVRPEY